MDKSIYIFLLLLVPIFMMGQNDTIHSNFILIDTNDTIVTPQYTKDTIIVDVLCEGHKVQFDKNGFPLGVNTFIAAKRIEWSPKDI